MMTQLVLILFLFLVVYFFPAFLAGARTHHASGWVFLLNLTCGWTVFGWLAVFVWAVAGQRASKEHSTYYIVIPVEPGSDPDDGERRPPLSARDSARRTSLRKRLPVEILKENCQVGRQIVGS